MNNYLFSVPDHFPNDHISRQVIFLTNSYLGVIRLILLLICWMSMKDCKFSTPYFLAVQVNLIGSFTGAQSYEIISL